MTVNVLSLASTDSTDPIAALGFAAGSVDELSLLSLPEPPQPDNAKPTTEIRASFFIVLTSIYELV
ncbi:hypothetical protein IFVP177_C250003 [Vibrio parahaemolyticus]